MGTLQHFSGDEILLSNQQAWQVLLFFFGGNASMSPASLTENDRSFAEALFIEAIDASEAMGYIESIFRSAMKLKPEIKDILKPGQRVQTPVCHSSTILSTLCAGF